MHIAFLTPEFPHEKTNKSGGLGTSIKNLALALVQQNIKVSVFIYGQSINEVFTENNICFHLIKQKKYQLGTWFFYRKHLNQYINKIIVQEKISCIEAPDYTGFTAFMRFKIPLIIRFHGSDTYFCYLEKRKQKLKNYWFEKLALNHANAFIAPTQFADELSAKLFKIKHKKIKIIPYGIDLSQFNNPNSQEYNPLEILYVGTIIRKKGVLELPKIFNLIRQQHPNAKLILAGNDSADAITGEASTWQLMQKLIHDIDKSNIKYIGAVNYNEVQTLIKNAHVCVFPTFAETLGMVTIEAMAMQKPVVNSNFGWAQEIIEDGKSGFLVHPENYMEFAKKVNDIFENEIVRNKIAENARLQVENKFDINQIVHDNITFYQNIIND